MVSYTMSFLNSLKCIFLIIFLISSENNLKAERPNIMIILTDDMGFSDLGCFGGEIDTPNLDQLAADGLRFTEFYNTARCWPTRATMLSGRYSDGLSSCLLYTSPSPRDRTRTRMPSSA